MKTPDQVAAEIASDLELMESLVGRDEDEFVKTVAEKVGDAMTEAEIRSGAILLRADGPMVSVGGGRYLPVTPGMIIQPPDVTMEDGTVRTPMQVLHPSITSAMVMADHDRGRLEKARAAAPAHLRRAFDHLDPANIITAAEAILERNGVRKCSAHEATDTVVLEFGRENESGVTQSANLSFNRTAAFAASLARMIADSFPSAVHMEVRAIKGSRMSHYEAVVRYVPATLLPPAQI